MGKVKKAAGAAGTIASGSSILPLTVAGAGFGAENTGRNATAGMLTGLIGGATIGATLVYLAETGHIDGIADLLKDNLTTWGARAVEALVPPVVGAVGGGTLGCCAGNISSVLVESAGATFVTASSFLCGFGTFFNKKKERPSYTSFVDDLEQGPSESAQIHLKERLSKLEEIQKTLNDIIETHEVEQYNRVNMLEKFKAIFGQEEEHPEYIQSSVYESYYHILDTIDDKLNSKYETAMDSDAGETDTAAWIQDNITNRFNTLVETIRKHWNVLTSLFHAEEAEYAASSPLVDRHDIAPPDSDTNRPLNQSEITPLLPDRHI